MRSILKISYPFKDIIYELTLESAEGKTQYLPIMKLTLVLYFKIWLAISSALTIFSYISQQMPRITLSTRGYSPPNRHSHNLGDVEYKYDDNGELRPGYYDPKHVWKWNDEKSPSPYDVSRGQPPTPQYAYVTHFSSDYESGSYFDQFLGHGAQGYLGDYASYSNSGPYAGHASSGTSNSYGPIPAPVGTSLQESIPQQGANRAATEVAYASSRGPRVVDISQLPPGVTYDPSREASPFGLPVLVGNRQKEFFYDYRGLIRDQQYHRYNTNGDVVGRDGNPVYKKKPGNRGYRKRDNSIDAITTLVDDSGNHTSTYSIYQSQFQKYLNTYYVAQREISALVFPFIQAITNATNDTLIYDVAMTAYVEIVGFPINLSGPFQGGLNATIWLEKQYFIGTNYSIETIAAIPNSKRTKNDIAALQYFTSYQNLLSVYLHAYHNGIKAANSTGILNTFWTLQKYLMANDTSIMSKEFTTIDTYYMKELFPHRIKRTVV